MDNGFLHVLAREIGVSEAALEMALTRTLLNRVLEREGTKESKGNKLLTFADLYLDQLTREVRRGERPIKLSRVEFSLLNFLMLHPRQVLTHDAIIPAVWGYDSDHGNSGNVTTYIGYVRAKTEAGGETRLIQNVWGVGFVLREEP